MLDPDYLLRISEGGEEIASKLHMEIIEKIVERIALRLDRGDNYVLTAQDKWQIEVLQESGLLLEDIQKIIAKYTGLMQTEIAEAMEDAGVKALEYDDEIYRAAGLSPTPLTESPHLIRLMQRTYEATMGEWVNFTRSTADAVQQSFIQACDTAYTQVAAGAVGYSQAYIEAINKIADEGVALVKYSKLDPITGKEKVHVDTIETATLRCIRTGVSQATAQITDARMDEMGWDVILTSAHIGARPGNGGPNGTNHIWWQGRFFSRTGKTKKFPLFRESTGYGTVTGLAGANCRHSYGPGDGVNNPFDTKDINFADQRKAYEISQRQRALERRIRKTKQEVMTNKASLDNATTDESRAAAEEKYQRKAALLQKQNAAYNQYCEENNLKKRSERVAVAQWDRHQAAKARAAAKRYNERDKHG